MWLLTGCHDVGASIIEMGLFALFYEVLSVCYVCLQQSMWVTTHFDSIYNFYTQSSLHDATLGGVSEIGVVCSGSLHQGSDNVGCKLHRASAAILISFLRKWVHAFFAKVYLQLRPAGT